VLFPVLFPPLRAQEDILEISVFTSSILEVSDIGRHSRPTLWCLLASAVIARQKQHKDGFDSYSSVAQRVESYLYL